MAQSLLIDQDEDREALQEHLLGDKENTGKSSKSSVNCESDLIGSDSDGLSPLIAGKKKVIKPVSQMTVLNDAVRRVTLPDGSPAPEPYEQPIQIDIVSWVPIMYLGEIIGSLTMTAFMVFAMDSSMILFGSDEECREELSVYTYLILCIVLLKTVLSCFVALKLFR